MEIKMAAGGLSVREINHLKDLKFLRRIFAAAVLYIYGNAQAQKYYEHLRVVVRDACLLQQENSQQPEALRKQDAIGPKTKAGVSVHNAAGETPGMPPEHLLGMAASDGRLQSLVECRI